MYKCVFTQNRAALAGCMDRLDASKCTTVCSHRAERLWPGGDMLLAHFRQHTFFSRHRAHRASLHRTELSIGHLLNGLMRNTFCIVKPMILKLSRLIEVHNLDGPQCILHEKTNGLVASRVSGTRGFIILKGESPGGLGYRPRAQPLRHRILVPVVIRTSYLERL